MTPPTSHTHTRSCSDTFHNSSQHASHVHCITLGASRAPGAISYASRTTGSQDRFTCFLSLDRHWLPQFSQGPAGRQKPIKAVNVLIFLPIQAKTCSSKQNVISYHLVPVPEADIACLPGRSALYRSVYIQREMCRANECCFRPSIRGSGPLHQRKEKNPMQTPMAMYERECFGASERRLIRLPCRALIA